MGQLRVLMLLGSLALSAQNFSETGGWSMVQSSCASAVSYILAAPVACRIAWGADMAGGFQVAACVGAVIYAASQTIDCGCQICRLTGSKCAKC